MYGNRTSRKMASALPPLPSWRRSAHMPTPAKNMSSSVGLMVWSMPSLKPVKASRTDATAANSSPPVIGSGMLYFERRPTRRLMSVPMSSTTTAASSELSVSRVIRGSPFPGQTIPARRPAGYWTKVLLERRFEGRRHVLVQRAGPLEVERTAVPPVRAPVGERPAAAVEDPDLHYHLGPALEERW